MNDTIESLEEQRVHGIYASEALRDADRLMHLFRVWDLMTHAQKAHEYETFGMRSVFRDIPGFEPRWCAACQSDSHFDYRDDPEGACGICGAWDGQEERAA